MHCFDESKGEVEQEVGLHLEDEYVDDITKTCGNLDLSTWIPNVYLWESNPGDGDCCQKGKPKCIFSYEDGKTLCW